MRRLLLIAGGVVVAAGALGCMARSGGAPGAANIAPGEATDETGGDRVADEREPPLGQLPEDVRPLAYRLLMRIVPDRDRFEGEVEIPIVLAERRSVIWMHGRDLDVTSVDVVAHDGRELAATWDPVGAPEADGVVAVRLPEPLSPGKATVRVRWSAAFDETLKGLYHVRADGDAYAFTQFESTYARGAFPCFDEPVFKTPFDVTLEVRAQDRALGNTPVVQSTDLPDGMKRLRLATSKPMPTYLVAWAVGPLEVVEAPPIEANEVRDRPLPLRGVAVRGKGPQLERALAETPAILASLERYLGRPYPYAKLDVVAVPDFASGAMENVGLVTFRDTLLLMDENPPEWQKRAFAYVMSHELAHMWFGNLVTMPWWDDLWLNEAFATWLGHRTVADVYADYNAELSLLGSVHRAMRADSLATARRIREPIDSDHDIRNAFDSITYEKGAGVLAMFEQWMGEDTFQAGLAKYLEAHAFDVANTEDLLAALASVTDREVAGPFESFLSQVGVPFVKIRVTCADEGTKLSLRQERYLPVGSEADSSVTWRTPVCVRMGLGDERVDDYCFLMDDREQDVLLEGAECADWVMPNAGGSGYYRFALDDEALHALRTEGWSQLLPREKLAVVDGVRAGFASAALDVPAVFGSLETFARSDVRQVVESPIDLLEFAHEHLVEQPHRKEVQRFARRLYAPVWRRLGWDPKPNEPGEDRLLRASVLRFLALGAEDPRIRRQAMQRARRYLGWGGAKVIQPDALSSDLVPTVLEVAVQEGDRSLFDHLIETSFEVDDTLLRQRMLSAVSHATRPERAERVRELVLDSRLRVNEVLTPLRIQLAMPETRASAWAWLTEHYDEVVARVATTRAGSLPSLASHFCSEKALERVRTFFEPRVAELPGGPRNLAGALEAIRLCAARVEAHREAANEFF